MSPDLKPHILTAMAFCKEDGTKWTAESYKADPKKVARLVLEIGKGLKPDDFISKGFRKKVVELMGAAVMSLLLEDMFAGIEGSIRSRSRDEITREVDAMLDDFLAKIQGWR